MVSNVRLKVEDASSFAGSVRFSSAVFRVRSGVGDVDGESIEHYCFKLESRRSRSLRGSPDDGRSPPYNAIQQALRVALEFTSLQSRNPIRGARLS